MTLSHADIPHIDEAQRIIICGMYLLRNSANIYTPVTHPALAPPQDVERYRFRHKHVFHSRDSARAFHRCSPQAYATRTFVRQSFHIGQEKAFQRMTRDSVVIVREGWNSIFY